MADFPAISSSPLIDGWEEGFATDPTIRSSAEAGYVQTRPRFTRLPDKYHVVYPDVSDGDKALVRAFEKPTVRGGAASFNYALPDSTVKAVRFKAPVSYRRVLDGTFWQIEFDLEEV